MVHKPSRKTQDKRQKGQAPGFSALRAAVPTVTGWRLWLFRGAVVVCGPILFLVALEVVLRLAGVGYDPSAAIPCQVQGVPSWADNPRCSWTYFPPALARQFEPFAFPQTKSSNAFRIMVLGESATQGIPDGAYSFTRVLAEMLRAAYPEVRFEVINAGVTAINSHVIYQIGKDLIRRSLDLVVVYMGNNEVIGPFGVGTVFGPFSRHLSLIRTGIQLRKTRVGQCLARFSQRGHDKLLQSWGGMEMFLDKQVRLSDPDLQVVYRHFRDNLTDLCTTATQAGTSVIVCTVASNLRDCPPFASLHRPDLKPADLKAWEGLYQQGIRLETEGHPDQAVESYQQAQAIDAQFAALAFRLARCLDRTGQYEEARSHYVQARDLDTLRFRADHQLNEIVRQVAGTLGPQGVSLVDIEQALAQQSDRQVPGEDLFYEHVHMNFSGNYLVSKALFEPVGRRVEARFGPGKEAPLTALSEEECRVRLAYTDSDRYMLARKVYQEFLLKPPFTGQVYHDQTLERWQKEMEGLKSFASQQEMRRAVTSYEQAMAMNPSDWNLPWKLGTLLADGLQDHARAEGPFRKVQELMPTFHLGYTGLGQVYLRLDRYAQAADQFEKSLGLYDAHATTHFLLGFIYEKQQDLVQATRHYGLAVYWQPTERIYYRELARVLKRQGREKEAEQVARKEALYCPGVNG